MREYLALVTRVMYIDIDAAAYMLNLAMDLEHFNTMECIEDCFSFCSTPQGYDYWHNIRELLG